MTAYAKMSTEDLKAEYARIEATGDWRQGETLTAIAEELRSRPVAARTWAKGQRVICNGYPGTITEVCTGQLQGMLVVRLVSGSTCVSANCPLTVQAA